MVRVSGEPTPLELAGFAVDAARRAGATHAEATSTVSERFSTEARETKIVKLEAATSRSLTLRVFLDGRKATLASSDLTREGLSDLIARTVDAARFVADDPFAALPEVAAAGTVDDAALEMFSPDIAARDSVAKLDDVRTMERIVRADPRIVNSNGSRLGDAQTTVALVNSNGFSGSYRASSVSLSSSPVAQDGENKRMASYGSAARSYARLESAEAVAALAAQRAVEMIGASKPETMRVPVIFERDVAASVLGDIFSAVSAANVAVGNSFLADKRGAKVGSEHVTIIDDGRLPAGIGTSPFDSEGVATRRTVVFDRGVLETFLFDTYYARKLGAQSTANAAGGGIGPNNFYLASGDHSLEDLIAKTARGVLVLNTIGFATETASGTYSRGARGFLILQGALAAPIDGFTIAGNLVAMLGAIDMVANDLRFDGTIVAPSFRVAEMTISGT